MKNLAKIVVLFVVFSMMAPVTTYAIALVGTTRESGGITFTRQVTGVRGGQAVDTTPGGYPTQLRDDDGQLMHDGKWFMAFCVEPGIKAHDGKEGELPVKTVTPDQKDGGLQAAWLIDNFYNPANSKTQLAALQIAVWEVITDTHVNYDLSSGDFKIWGGSQEALDIAYSYLINVPKNFDVDYLNSRYLIAVHPSKQDFIIQICSCCPTQ